jgi:hypothetical protein
MSRFVYSLYTVSVIAIALCVTIPFMFFLGWIAHLVSPLIWPK